MRNGSGDEYPIVFSAGSAYIRGFDHEAVMSPYGNDAAWPGVLDSVPEDFRDCVTKLAFDEDGMRVVITCLWREIGDDRWRIGKIDYSDGVNRPDGVMHLFARLVDPSAEAFRCFAEDYYGVPMNLGAVRHAYAPARRRRRWSPRSTPISP
ncbi:hypothetical protein GCM10014719_30760 [Planomonospora parontospora subsp. antibiotica]|nr:hypothetical protein GCM10014719_30760 [Planomonospora parontospora subsp. antibiotica]GII16567.1 hypothetical protein Ppa05_32930 [Planomonospora parontospora subsp. antibiotica]